MARIPIRTRVAGALFFIAIACRLEPTEPPHKQYTQAELEYAYCPEGTSQWGEHPINPIKMWCELDDGGGYHGPYREWWPSETVTGSLGPQAEGRKVKGWYEDGEKVGDWQYWYRDGGLDRIEHYRPRSPSPPPPRASGCSDLRCSDAPCGIHLGGGSGCR